MYNLHANFVGKEAQAQVDFSRAKAINKETLFNKKKKLASVVSSLPYTASRLSWPSITPSGMWLRNSSHRSKFMAEHFGKEEVLPGPYMRKYFQAVL